MEVLDNIKKFIDEVDLAYILLFTLTLYLLSIVVIIIFTRRMTRKMARDFDQMNPTFINLGEARHLVFFLDLKSDTGKADLLECHDFLDEFFTDIPHTALQAGNAIYKQFENQIFITWEESKMDNTSCIKAYFLMRPILRKNKKKYLRKYDFIRDIRFCLWPDSRDSRLQYQKYIS